MPCVPWHLLAAPDLRTCTLWQIFSASNQVFVDRPIRAFADAWPCSIVNGCECIFREQSTADVRVSRAVDPGGSRMVPLYRSPDRVRSAM
jgi:hypothetical protein